MAPLGVSFHLLIEDQGLVLSAILVPFDSNWFMLCPWAMSFFQKLCPAPFPPVNTWRILWIEEPGGLQSMGSQRVGHSRATVFFFNVMVSFLY